MRAPQHLIISVTVEDAVMTGSRTVVLSLPGALPIEAGLPIVLHGKVIAPLASAASRHNRMARSPRPVSTRWRRRWGAERCTLPLGEGRETTQDGNETCGNAV
jgi:hypothetical protein